MHLFWQQQTQIRLDVEGHYLELEFLLMFQMQSSEGVFLLAASSKRDNVDLAVRRPGRLDTEINVGVPNAKQRLHILEKLLSTMRISLQQSDIAEVANNAHGFTGADLRAVCSEGRKLTSGKNYSHTYTHKPLRKI